MQRKMTAILLSSVMLLSACAKSSGEIGAAYVSPLTYRDYNCQQMEQEIDRISHRLSELTQSIDKNAENDAVAMGVGLVLFWPALFFIEGDSPEAQEYARLKGEFEVLEKEVIRKQCSFEYESPFAEIEKAKAEAEAKQKESLTRKRR